MEPHHETGFPATLCRWVGEIVQSSPEAARLTLLELIVGALLASGGHVTQAILALTPRLGWQAYHWMLERFRLLGLISALCRIVRREIGERRCFAIIDDTLAPRSSAQAPGVAVRFDHAANGRCSCCASASSRSWCRAGIARCRWSPACAEVRATPVRSPWPCRARSAPSCLLLDAWYRRGSLIRTALRLGHEVIGQATPPCSRCPRRGSLQGAAGSMVGALMPMQSQHCPSRSTPSPAMAGPAAPCRVPPTLPQGRHRPWCALEKGSGWPKAPLLLSTDPTLSAPVEAYSGRWTIEPLFRDLKTVYSLGAMWQRGRIALLRWLHLVQIARTPADRKGRAADPCPDPPRRLAATLVKEALAARFRNFEAFRLLPETYRNAAPLRSTAPGQKPRHSSERNYLWRPTLPSRCLSAMCPMPTNSS